MTDGGGIEGNGGGPMSLSFHLNSLSPPPCAGRGPLCGARDLPRLKEARDAAGDG